VPLEVDVRRLGDVTLLKCKGRIVAGEESQILQRHVTDRMDSDRQFVLHLGEVTFVDSSGLGLLVRLAGVTRAARGDIKLCSVGRDVAHTLTITNLKTVLETHESEVEAVSAFYEKARRQESGSRTGTKLLCVDHSEDVLALLRELLRHAGYAPVTTSNLFDARVLAKATKPALVVIGPNINAENAQSIQNAAGNTPVVALANSFANLEASQAAEHVLAAVQEKLPKN
jgi:anti-sigma B factor antagonist